MMANPRVRAAVNRLSLHLLQHENASEVEVIGMVSEIGARYQPILLRLAIASQPDAEE
jgi:hypothetical protein